MSTFGALSFAEAIVLIGLRLKEAMSTMRRCRYARHDLPDTMRSQWPGVVQQCEDAYGYYGDPGHPKIGPPASPERRPGPSPAIPSPEQLDRMDAALNWLWWTPEGSRGIVAGKAAGLSWGAMSAESGIPVIEVRTRYKLGVEAILAHLIDEG